jgi:hypothetical protein
MRAHTRPQGWDSIRDRARGALTVTTS